MKSASLIVIGDEILTGKIKDENSFIFANTMFDRGVKVPRIETIPDGVDIIAERVRAHAKDYDYVCTSGGVGPTHDDVTFDGVAKAFSLPLVLHDEALSYFQKAQSKASRGDTVSVAQQKMLILPSPCTVHFLAPLWLPLVQVKNIYIFPGVPHLFQKLMTDFSSLFTGEKFYREIIYTNLSESLIAFELKKVQDATPSVAIGSYPQMPGKSYNVMITIEGTSEQTVQEVAKCLLPLIEGRSTCE